MERRRRRRSHRRARPRSPKNLDDCLTPAAERLWTCFMYSISMSNKPVSWLSRVIGALARFLAMTTSAPNAAQSKRPSMGRIKRLYAARRSENPWISSCQRSGVPVGHAKPNSPWERHLVRDHRGRGAVVSAVSRRSGLHRGQRPRVLTAADGGANSGKDVANAARGQYAFEYAQTGRY